MQSHVIAASAREAERWSVAAGICVYAAEAQLVDQCWGPHSLLLRSWWGFLAPAPVALRFQWKEYTSTFRKKFLYQYILLLLLCHKNNEMLQMTSLCLKNLEFG